MVRSFVKLWQIPLTVNSEQLSVISYQLIQIEVDQSVLLYNTEKPHIKLQRKSPIQFEKEYLCINNCIENTNRIIIIIFLKFKRKISNKTVNIIQA